MALRLRHLIVLTPLLGSLLGTSQCGDDPVTWYRDVYPITRDNCQSCHQDGGIAPFSLETYASAAPHAVEMAAAVETGYMPPWMPDGSCQSFEDARVLTQEQKDIFGAWSRQGAPEGDPADAPPEVEPEPGLLWIDASLAAEEAYTPSGEYMDEYRCFVLEPGLTEAQTLIGYEIHPGHAAEVHHVLLYETDLEEARALDAADPDAGYLCFGGIGTDSSNMLGAWAPGSGATRFPEDTGISMTPGKAMVMQIHYNLHNGDPMPDQTSIDLQYAHADVIYPATFSSLAQSDFAIPPYAPSYSASASLIVSTDVTLWGVFPHMHQLGKDISVNLKRDGVEECLVHIPSWDFHWQQLYFYDTPQGLPVYAGDRVTLTCTWSNNTGAVVTWGEGTDDEMCLNYFYVTAPAGAN